MIRLAELADANSIERINRESLNYNYPLVDTRKRLADVLAMGYTTMFWLP